MQPVLGLVEDDAPRPVQDGVGDLLATVGGQAVHDEGLRRGEAKQGVIDLVALEGLEPLLALGLLPHADPDVGIEHVGALGRFARVRGDAYLATQSAASLEHLWGGLITRRTGRPHPDPGQGGEEEQRVQDIVAVADPGELQTLELDAPLPEREEIGHGLARMLEVGEGVDDGYGGVARQLLERPVGEDPRGDAVDPAREIASDVGHGLALAHADLLGGEIDGGPAQLDHGDLEGDPRAQGRLLEDEGEGAPGQRRDALPGLDPGLQLGRELEDVEDVLPVEVADGEKMIHGAVALSAVSMMSQACPISLSLTMRAGARRSVLSPAVRASNPRSRQAATTSPTGGTTSRPTSRPRPRRSFTALGCLARKASSPCRRILPI